MTVKEVREVVNAYKYDGKEEAEKTEEAEATELIPFKLDCIRMEIRMLNPKSEQIEASFLEARTTNDIKGLIKELENYL